MPFKRLVLDCTIYHIRYFVLNDLSHNKKSLFTAVCVAIFEHLRNIVPSVPSLFNDILSYEKVMTKMQNPFETLLRAAKKMTPVSARRVRDVNAIAASKLEYVASCVWQPGNKTNVRKWQEMPVTGVKVFSNLQVLTWPFFRNYLKILELQRGKIVSLNSCCSLFVCNLVVLIYFDIRNSCFKPLSRSGCYKIHWLPVSQLNPVMSTTERHPIIKYKHEWIYK